jgi:hypothetical protein
VFTGKIYIVKYFYFYLYKLGSNRELAQMARLFKSNKKKYLVKKIKLLSANNRARMDQFDYRKKKVVIKKLLSKATGPDFKLFTGKKYLKK